MDFLKNLNPELLFAVIIVIVIIALGAQRSMKIWLHMEKILFRKKKYELLEQSKKPRSETALEKICFHADTEVKKHNETVQKFLSLYDNNLQRIPKRRLLQIVSSYKYERKIPLFVEAIIIYLRNQEIESSALLELLVNMIPFEKKRIESLLV